MGKVYRSCPVPCNMERVDGILECSISGRVENICVEVQRVRTLAKATHHYWELDDI